MKASGGSLRNEKIIAMQSIIDTLFVDDPSYRDDVCLWNNNHQIPARVYEHKYRDGGSPRRKIQTRYDSPFDVGDIFKIGEDGFWLCIEAFNGHNMNWQGTLEYCNSFLRFLVNGEIKEYPVVAKNATQYNSGEANKSQMILGSSQHLIYIPCDNTTLQIDNGYRFLMDKNQDIPTAYKLTQVDTTSLNYGSKGILQWTIMEDQFSPIRDNKELMIADYFKNKSVYTIQIINASSPLRLNVGQSFQLDITVTKDGSLCVPESIIYSSNDPATASIENGMITANAIGNCKIIIKVEDVSTELEVRVIEELMNNNYTLSIISSDGDNSIIYGDTEQFFVVLYKNDVEQTDFEIQAEIIQSENLCKIFEIKGTSIFLSAVDNRDNIGKFFMLRVWVDGIDVVTELPIKVGGLW